MFRWIIGVLAILGDPSMNQIVTTRWYPPAMSVDTKLSIDISTSTYHYKPQLTYV